MPRYIPRDAGAHAGVSESTGEQRSVNTGPNGPPGVGMTLPQVAIVAIGRNEGERLRRCLDSVRGRVACAVYVDSGSTDGSVEMARSKGVEVVGLDLRQPFTAARARNAGFQRVLELMPDVRYVQFVDGDCEVVADWLERAHQFLSENPRVAAVCGRRRERFPERSIYNRLCDMEWDIPPGPVRSCGGDVLMRADALHQVGGYRDSLIAGEEPELCVRLRAQGWQIHALKAEMTLHDAGMTRLRQWWLRIKRSGYAFAEGAHLHGAAPERHRIRESRRAWAWGLGLPLCIAVAVALLGPWAGLLLLIYPLQVLRQFMRLPGSASDRGLRAAFQVLGRFPEMMGQLQFVRDRLLGRSGRLIEYK
jgi:GT2 family glycosyltransferase